MFELTIFIKRGPFGIFSGECEPIIIVDYELLDKYLYFKDIDDISQWIRLDKVISFEIKEIG